MTKRIARPINEKPEEPDFDDDTESDKGSNWKLIRRLARDSLGDYRGRLAGALFFMLLMAGSTAGLAWIMRSAINQVFLEKNATAMWGIAASVLLLAITKGFADFAQTVMMTKIGNGIVSKYQSRIFKKLLSLDVAFFTRVHSSKLIARVNNNARAAKDVILLIITSVGRDFLTLLALMGVMIAQDPLLSLAALAIGPFVIIGVMTLVRKARALADAEFKGMSQIIQSTQETFQGIRTVKAFTLEDEMQARFEETVHSVERRRNAIARIGAIMSPLMETLGGVLIASVLVYAGWQTIFAGKTPGEFMSFIAAFLLAYEPAKRLANVQVSLQRNLRGAHKMYKLLDMEAPEAPVAVSDVALPAGGEIVLSDIVFGYGKKEVIHGVSITARSGEIVALVGPSGSGKSTLFSLVQRFFTPWSGSIMIGGVDISTIDHASLRKGIGVVSQEVNLFAGTIAENIRLGRPDAGAAEVRAAADAAMATKFIEQLPQGFDTLIGERGTTLSGGQAQRIAIARAMLKQAPILLLDEATSALDAETERDVREAISALMKSKTTLVIAHRLSTIAKADRIYLLVDGRVIDSGTHPQLKSRSEIYRRLFATEIELQ